MTQTPLQVIVAEYHATCRDALTELSEAELKWQPPAEMNPIGAILLHVISSEDMFLTTLAQDKPSLYMDEGWRQRLRIKTIPMENYQGWWEEIAQVPFALSDIRAYMQEVQANTQTYIAHVADADLNQTVSVFGGEQHVMNLIATVITHGSTHIGEINTLRAIFKIGWR